MDADSDTSNDKSQELTMEDDSDSSEISDSEIDEDKMRLALEEQFKCPRSYDMHVAAVELSFTSGNVVYIDKACMKMSEEFPLTPAYWLKYIHYLKKACKSSGNNTLYDIDHFYLRGLGDYYSVELQLDYLNWVLGSENCNKIRTAFKDAIGREGLHPIDGNAIWFMFKQYETAVFTSLNAEEQTPENLIHVVNLIKCYLMFPNNSLTATYATFLELCKECPSVDTTGVQQQVEKYEKLNTDFSYFENQLKAVTNDDAQKLRIYYEYITAAEASSFTPSNYLESLYHRATSELCLNSTLWVQYCKQMIKSNDTTKCNVGFFIKESELTDITKNVESHLTSECGEPLNTIIRSLKNCPSSVDLLVLKMKVLEKIETVSIADIRKEFELALQNADSNTLSLWIIYLETLRRKSDLNDQTQIDRLRKTFSLALDTLELTWGIDADPHCEITKYWSRLEYTKLGDPSRGRELWNTVLDHGTNKMSPYLWIELAQMEYIRGGPVFSRRIYRRSASECTSIILGDAWLAFERVHGSAAEVDQCITTCQIDGIISSWDRSNESKTYVAEGYEENKRTKKLHHQKSKDPRMSDQSHENQKQSLKSKSNRESTNESSSAGQRSNKRTKSDTKYKSKGEPSSKKVKKEDNIHESLSQEMPSVADIKLVDNEANEGGCKRVIHDASKDGVTIFVSNLDYSVNEDDIKSALNSKADLGIVELRLVKTPFGKSKGYAYVQLKDTAAVIDALSLDRTPVSGRPMFISRCQGEKDNRKHSFKYPEKLEANKIFIRGLPFDITDTELKDMFAKHGELKEVRLVTFRNGNPKGLAYVEYMTPSSASTAIMQTDNTELRGFIISVSLSAPPARKTNRPFEENIALDRSKMLGGAPREQLLGNPKAKLSFIPRSVQKSVLSKINEKMETVEQPLKTEMTSETTEAATSAPKSNDDFRKLMFGDK